VLSVNDAAIQSEDRASEKQIAKEPAVSSNAGVFCVGTVCMSASGTWKKARLNPFDVDHG
jgi:hypothetical protein